MELHNFEKSMHQKFQDFEPEVNDLKIWDGIESKIPQKKKHRAIFWIWWIGLPILLVSVLTYFTISDSNYASLENQRIEKQSMQNAPTEKQVVEGIKMDKSNNQNADLTKSSGQTSVKASQVERDTKINEISAVVEDKTIINASIKSVQKGNTSFAQEEQFSNSRNTKNILDTQKPTNEFVSNKRVDKHLTGKNYQASHIMKESRASGLLSIDLLPSIIYGIKFTEVTTELKSTWDPQLFNREKKKKFKASHSVGLQTGYAKMYSDYQSTDISLLNLRESSETPLEQLSLGLIYKYQLSNRISLQSGLNFWQANWQSIHTTASQEVLSINFQQITRTQEISYKKYGKDRAISLPISIEFDFVKKKKFASSFGLGYEFNLYGTHKGFEIDANNVEYNIENDSENRYLNRSGNYLMAQIGAGYNLNTNTIVQINMSYKYGLNAFQTQASSVQKTYRFLGLNAGILKRIN